MVYNVFSKLICILVMAEGGYDPRDETTDKDPLIPGTGDDDDDDDLDLSKIPIVLDPEEPDRTQPFTPGAASTPAGGESIPMTERTRLPQERGSLIGETSFGGEPTGRAAWQEIREEFEMADESKLRARYKKAPRSGGAIPRGLDEGERQMVCPLHKEFRRHRKDFQQVYSKRDSKCSRNTTGTTGSRRCSNGSS